MINLNEFKLKDSDYKKSIKFFCFIMKTISQDVTVTKDDQKNINNFSKMYSRHQ